jgi:hypothetical protein
MLFGGGKIKFGNVFVFASQLLHQMYVEIDFPVDKALDVGCKEFISVCIWGVPLLIV